MFLIERVDVVDPILTPPGGWVDPRYQQVGVNANGVARSIQFSQLPRGSFDHLKLVALIKTTGPETGINVAVTSSSQQDYKAAIHASNATYDTDWQTFLHPHWHSPIPNIHEVTLYGWEDAIVYGVGQASRGYDWTDRMNQTYSYTLMYQGAERDSLMAWISQSDTSKGFKPGTWIAIYGIKGDQ